HPHQTTNHSRGSGSYHEPRQSDILDRRDYDVYAKRFLKQCYGSKSISKQSHLAYPHQQVACQKTESSRTAPFRVIRPKDREFLRSLKRPERQKGAGLTRSTSDNGDYESATTSNITRSNIYCKGRRRRNHSNQTSGIETSGKMGIITSYSLDGMALFVWPDSDAEKSYLDRPIQHLYPWSCHATEPQHYLASTATLPSSDQGATQLSVAAGLRIQESAENTEDY
ncbi:hypothetical protein QZH41_020554, partial [Actinostola sp. cb2023]